MYLVEDCARLQGYFRYQEQGDKSSNYVAKGMERLRKMEERTQGRRLDEVGPRRQGQGQRTQEATAGGGRRYRYMVVLNWCGQGLELATVYPPALGSYE